jgi:oligopeptide/dipeptide ABC transporter ATP-binding protein
VTDAPLLELEAVTATYGRGGGRAGAPRALDAVGLRVMQDRSLGVIGDSGAGKTTLCRVATGLMRPLSGAVRVAGMDLARASRGDWQRARRHIGLVFQDAQGSFNPMRPVMDGIGMPLLSYGALSAAELRGAVGAAMEQVGLPPSQMTRYPHEFSGGQIQRLAIARALTTRPRLLLLDEPVSALDVSIRAQILNLLVDLAGSLGLTYVVISSDPAVVRHLTAEALVLFGGKVVETATTSDLFATPLHPYTASLLALRDPEIALRGGGLAKGDRVQVVASDGCRFAGVCSLEQPQCRTVVPMLLPFGAGRQVSCHGRIAARAGPVEGARR